MLLLFHDNKVGKTEGCTLIQGSVCSRNSHGAVIYNFVEGAGLHKMQDYSKCKGSALPQSKRNLLVAVTTGAAKVGKPNCWPGAALGHHKYCQGPGKPHLLLSGGGISTLMLSVANEGMSPALGKGQMAMERLRARTKRGSEIISAADKPQHPQNHSIPCS